MFATQQFISHKLQDLDPILAGWSVPTPCAQSTPEVLNYTLMHFVPTGRGKIVCGSESYPVSAGQVFMIFPGDVITHVADSETPWTLKWLGFTGSLSHSFKQLPRVFDLPKHLLPHLQKHDCITEDTAFELASDLMLFYTKMVRKDAQRPDYVQFVMDYVQSSYMHKISVQSIADQLSLDRSYLARQFKKRTNQSIQSYILNVRIMAAKRHLMQGSTVKEAAALCGFNDTANFSKLFAREEDGLSPQAWKKVVAANLKALE